MGYVSAPTYYLLSADGVRRTNEVNARPARYGWISHRSVISVIWSQNMVRVKAYEIFLKIIN